MQIKLNLFLTQRNLQIFFFLVLKGQIFKYIAIPRKLFKTIFGAPAFGRPGYVAALLTMYMLCVHITAVIMEGVSHGIVKSYIYAHKSLR